MVASLIRHGANDLMYFYQPKKSISVNKNQKKGKKIIWGDPSTRHFGRVFLPEVRSVYTRIKPRLRVKQSLSLHHAGNLEKNKVTILS